MCSIFMSATKSVNVPLLIAGLSGGLGVSLGALGAHALAPLMDAVDTRAYNLANQYHLVHSIAMMLVAAIIPYVKEESAVHLQRIYALFAGGTAFLAIPQYIHSTCHKPKFLKKLNMLGGMVLMFAWCYIGAIGVLAE